MKKQGISCKPMTGRKMPWSDERRAAFKDAIDTPAYKEAHRVSLLKRFDELRGSSADSPLEAILHGALKRAGLSFRTQRRMLGRYVVDIELLQKPVIIEADGLRHLLERAKASDAQRDAALAEAGYQVFRFTGSQINTDPDACVRSVVEAARISPDTDPIADIRRGGRGEDNPNWQGAQIEHTCTGCGETFVQYRTNRAYTKKFCNQKCYGTWLREHPEVNPVHLRWQRHREQQVVA